MYNTPVTPKAKAGQAHRNKKYAASEKGKAKRQARRERILASNQRAVAKYRKTEKSRARLKRYKQSEKGKASARRYKMKLADAKRRAELNLGETTVDEMEKFLTQVAGTGFRFEPSDAASCDSSSADGRQAGPLGTGSGSAIEAQSA